MAIDSIRTERIVGFFILLLIAVTATLVVLMLRQRDWFSKKFEIHAVFEKGTGIAEGTPVLMEGMQIGRLTTLRFSAHNELEGTLAINVAYHRQIRKDSVATVMHSHLLANPQIDISVGSSDEPLLGQGARIQAVATMEPTMKDFLNLGNNLVAVVRDLRDPTGTFQKMMRNMEGVSGRLAQGSGSVTTMMRDDGRLYNDSRELLGDFNRIMKEKSSLPITLTEQSQLILNLSEKLDKQTDIFARVAKKMDKICDRLLQKDNMAGALLTDSEFYAEARQFFREGRVLLMDVQELAVDMRTVVPKLPGLIDEAKADIKEMGKVLRGVQRLPFVGGGDEPAPKPQTLQLPGRLDSLEAKK